MAKSTVSHRVDGELLKRVDALAKKRRSTRSVLIEEGLRLLLEVAGGGVPVLPEPAEQVEEVEEHRVRPVVAQGPSLGMLRQVELNKAKYR